MNYATGMATSRVSLVNMYIYGASLISIFTVMLGMLFVQDMMDAIDIWIEWYLLKLIPWPFDEMMDAFTLIDLAISHGVTITVGITVATVKWWIRV